MYLSQVVQLGTSHKILGQSPSNPEVSPSEEDGHPILALLLYLIFLLGGLHSACMGVDL